MKWKNKYKLNYSKAYSTYSEQQLTLNKIDLDYIDSTESVHYEDEENTHDMIFKVPNEDIYYKLVLYTFGCDQELSDYDSFSVIKCSPVQITRTEWVNITK